MSTASYVPPTIRRNRAGFFDKHGLSPPRQVCGQIDGVSVVDLTRRYGSPLFVYSERMLRRKYRDAHRAFSSRYPRVQFAWSYKTNYLNAICSVFHQEGALAEVVSDFEYEKARKLGVPGNRIVFNGPYKTREILRQALAEGARVQVDNWQEIAVLQELAPQLGRRSDVAVRVNLETGSQPKWSKFGFCFESGEAMRAIRRLLADGRLRLVGLHAHIGTFILEPQQYSQSMAKLADLAGVLRSEFGVELEYLNAGGGFASANTLHYQYLPGHETAPSFEQYADAICNTLHERLPAGQPQPALYLETGRALVDEAGYLVSTVLDARHSGEGNRSILIDAGVNLLYTAAWYKFDVQPAQENASAVEPTVVYGPLCMNIDEIRRDAPLPQMAPGEQVVIHPVGAYNITQSMQFITYRPAVVMIGEDGQVDVIRQRETLEHVQRLEAVPERLQVGY